MTRSWAICALGLAAGVVIAVTSPAAPPAPAPPSAARWKTGQAIPVWIENVNVPQDYRDMVRRAMRAWEGAADGFFGFRETEDFPSTGIRVRFVKGDTSFGEAMPYLDPSRRIVRADVVLSMDASGDDLQRQLVVYLTALHEIGHALGLAHSVDFDRIMYRFQRATDPGRYFRKYRARLRSAEDIGSVGATGLSTADRNALRRLYSP